MKYKLQEWPSNAVVVGGTESILCIFVAGLLENKVNLNSSFSLVEVEV